MSIAAWLGHNGSRVHALVLDELRPLWSSRAAVNALNTVLPTQGLARTRTAALRSMGLRIGQFSQVQGPLYLTGRGSTADVEIADYALVTGHLYIDLGAPVKIGRGVRLGHHVTLLTTSHEVGESLLRAGKTRYGSITIGQGAWIASRVTVLPGVTIGRGAVVAAGAVVTGDVEPNTLVGGVPARVIRRLTDTLPADSAA